MHPRCFAGASLSIRVWEEVFKPRGNLLPSHPGTITFPVKGQRGKVNSNESIME